jgi:hypothetical protein
MRDCLRITVPQVAEKCCILSSEARNLFLLETHDKRDSSACSARRNHKMVSFSAACPGVTFANENQFGFARGRLPIRAVWQTRDSLPLLCSALI